MIWPQRLISLRPFWYYCSPLELAIYKYNFNESYTNYSNINISFIIFIL